MKNVKSISSLRHLLSEKISELGNIFVGGILLNMVITGSFSLYRIITLLASLVMFYLIAIVVYNNNIRKKND
jgi:hypothetical protein